jgi:hypothetical protein
MAVDKWFSRITNLGQWVQWAAGSSLLAGIGVAISGYLSGLAPSVIFTLALVAVFAVLGIANQAATWFNARGRSQSVVPLSTSVGLRVEEYAVQNAMRFEAEATQAREEIRKTVDEKKHLEQRVGSLEEQLARSVAAAKEMNNGWTKLAREIMDELRKTSVNAQDAYHTITQIDDALVTPTPQGLLQIMPEDGRPEHRIDKAQKAIFAWRSQLIANVSGQISSVPIGGILGKALQDNPTKGGSE